MGLDVVELVMKCEDEFEVKLEDWKLERMRTVGDLFELICEQLNLPYGPDAPLPVAPPALAIRDALNRDTVWTRLVEVVIDQLQVDRSEVRYAASFLDDLGAD